jgi:hypothetical protein
MKPYGRRSSDDTDEQGPPSKIGKIKSKNRKTSRRLLHKQGRQDAKKELQ